MCDSTSSSLPRYLPPPSVRLQPGDWYCWFCPALNPAFCTVCSCGHSCAETFALSGPHPGVSASPPRPPSAPERPALPAVATRPGAFPTGQLSTASPLSLHQTAPGAWAVSSWCTTGWDTVTRSTSFTSISSPGMPFSLCPFLSTPPLHFSLGRSAPVSSPYRQFGRRLLTG